MADTVKEEKKEEEKDELAALDALDKEASEYKKVLFLRFFLLSLLLEIFTANIKRTPKLTVSSKPFNSMRMGP